MAFFSWVGAEQRLSNAALTVLVQAISPNDQDQLLWDVFFPRQDVDSVVVETITPLIATRFVSDRREWNARGRFIPQEFPGTGELEMVPIEAYFKLAEREIQNLEETAYANEALFQKLLGVQIPDRTEGLARANLRRIELDTFNAWSLGQVSVRNPVTGTLYTASYGFDVTRYTTAGPAWTGGVGGTAYNSLLTWLLAGIDRGMTIQGVMLRLSTREAIRTSAPNMAFPVNTNIPPVLADVEKRLSDEIGAEFRFYLNERHVDVFATGGLATTVTKLWPALTVAVVPAGETVGFQAYAPVARAFDISRTSPEAEIDVNGMIAYTETAGNGRELTVECQVNAMPVPLERNIWVINAGI
jgi:hypothetical protein